MDTIELPDTLFAAPCTICIAGPSGSAKTCIAFEILKYRQQLFSQPVAGAVYFYSEMQDMFRNNPPPDVKFHHGMPSEDEIERYIDSFDGQHFLFLFDDLMSQGSQSTLMQDIATKLSHHRNFSTITINQNIFQSGKTARTQSLNSQYFLLSRTCRDVRQIGTLGSQLFPGKGSKFIQLYKEAVDTSLREGEIPFLFINCHPFRGVRGCQLLSSIFPPGGAMLLWKLE